MDNEKIKEMLLDFKATISTTNSDRLTVELFAYCVGIKPDMSVQDAYRIIREIVNSDL